MIEIILSGLKCGLLAASTVGSFLICIALTAPVIVLAYTFVGLIFNFGGNKHE